MIMLHYLFGTNIKTEIEFYVEMVSTKLKLGILNRVSKRGLGNMVNIVQ